MRGSLKKSKETNSELMDYLINYRNWSIGLLPANLLQSQKIRTKLPIKELMINNDIQTIKGIMKENQNNQKEYFDKNAEKNEEEIIFSLGKRKY